MKSGNPYKGAMRYIDNARLQLKQAGKEDNFYIDEKYVKTACGTAYSGMLKALDFLFDIKKDLSELKTMMFQMAQHSDIKSSGIKDDDYSTQRLLKSGNIFSESTIDPIPFDDNHGRNDYFESHTEISDVHDNLSLQDKEKEMIKEALIKHKGRRKPAAKELGISERTLYRKIKEYNL